MDLNAIYTFIPSRNSCFRCSNQINAWKIYGILGYAKGKKIDKIHDRRIVSIDFYSKCISDLNSLSFCKTKGYL